MSANEVIIQQQAEKIKALEQIIGKQNDEIQDLRSQLDKFKSVMQLPTTKTITSGPRKVRAQGISAEPKALKDLEDIRPETFKTYPKSTKTKELLIAAIQGNEFMKNLSPQNIQEIVEHMYPTEYKRGSTIIKEGDVGSIVYVMEEGQVEVTKEAVKLSVMNPGKVFGELAVLYNCTRTATVRALDLCKLWALDRSAFQGILMRTELLKQKEKMELIRRVPKYQNENERFLQNVVDSLEEVHYSKERVIINQHSIISSLYIILRGVVLMKEDGKAPKLLHSGDYFGCLDSQNQITSSSTMVAQSDSGADVLILENETLSQLMNELNLLSTPHKDSRYQDLEPTDIRDVVDLRRIATIGIGGFGRVDLVQPLLDSSRSYALKKMRKNHIVETRQQEHIFNERNIMLEARCDFIVRLFKTFRDDKYLYMLLEPCLGGELWTLLRDKVSFDESSTRFYVSCVIEAFTYLHQRGIIYRDLKPENLLLDEKGYIKLVDFGFAKKIGVGRRTWTFCGTPEYVAPEIILNRGHDSSSDLWSLGILIYELLTGNPPFTGSEPMKTYNLILKGIESVDFSHSIPKHAQSLIKKLCRDNPSDRIGHGSTNLKEVRKHKWLNNFNWDALKARKLNAPFILPVKDRADVSNFDSFPAEESNEPPDDLSGWDKDF